MSLLAFALQLYFAMILGVSGLMKFENPSYFADKLLQQHLLPSWSIGFISRTLPIIEMVIAFFLISGIALKFNAIVVITLFMLFLLIKIYLFVTGSDADCACYGSTNSQKVDGASVIVSILLVLLSIAHLWLADQFTSVSWQWRFFTSLIFIGAGLFFVRKIITRRTIHISTEHVQPLDVGGLSLGEKAPPFVATDQNGNSLNLDHFQGIPYLLTFVTPGCPACPKALEIMENVLQSQQKVSGLVVGSSDFESNRIYAAEHKVNLPFLTPLLESTKKLYNVQVVPFIYLVDEAGIIRAKGIISNMDHLEQLLTSTLPQ